MDLKTQLSNTSFKNKTFLQKAKSVLTVILLILLLTPGSLIFLAWIVVELLRAAF